jgi:hypothetical protein
MLMLAALMGSADALAGPDGVQATSATRRYELTTETGMPHLEESLRYAVRREMRCLDPHDLSAVFWMLDDVSLQDCRLVKAAQARDSAHYDLLCTGGHGTSGVARWDIEPRQLRGTLDVKLGGKNMTFYQRVVATPAEDDISCSSR